MAKEAYFFEMHPWIGRVTINVDHPRLRGMQCLQRFTEKPFGGLTVSLGAEQEFDRIAI
jgi:hypothetical protein